MEGGNWIVREILFWGTMFFIIFTNALLLVDAYISRQIRRGKMTIENMQLYERGAIKSDVPVKDAVPHNEKIVWDEAPDKIPMAQLVELWQYGGATRERRDEDDEER